MAATLFLSTYLEHLQILGALLLSERPKDIQRGNEGVGRAILFIYLFSFHLLVPIPPI